MELALKLIAQAKQTRATRLDLGNCGLTELPDELFELTWLEELILSNSCWEYSYDTMQWTYFRTQNFGVENNIKFFNTDIKYLNKLKKLVAAGDRSQWSLSDLTPLKGLVKLQYLDIFFNSS